MTDAPESDRSDAQLLARLPQLFADAWNRHDAAALGALFAEDADFVNVLGLWWRGRNEIVAMHARLHATIFAHSVLAFQAVAVRRLGANSAVVRSRWSMTGHTDATGTWAQERTGILVMVAARAGAGWSIVDAQNTDVGANPGGGALPGELR